MPHLPVTNLVTNLLQKFVTYVTNLLHICYILVTAVFIDPEVRNYKNKIVSPKSMLCLHNGLFRFGSDYFETECHCNLCNKFCNKFVTSVSKFVASVFLDPEVKNFKQDCFTEIDTMLTECANYTRFRLLLKSISF